MTGTQNNKLKSKSMDIIDALKKQGIHIKQDGNDLLLNDGNKEKQIEITKMEELLLQTIINWFKY